MPRGVYERQPCLEETKAKISAKLLGRKLPPEHIANIVAAKGGSNPEMKSTNYYNVHYWIRKTLGKPNRCDLCGKTEAKRFEWSNISQEYKKDVTDWQRACVPCHAKFDIEVKKGLTT